MRASKLRRSPERIPTNLLADRLKRLEAAGVIARSVYQERPTRYTYQLTEKGKALGHVLRAVAEWGKKHIPGTRTLDERTPARRQRQAPSSLYQTESASFE